MILEPTDHVRYIKETYTGGIAYFKLEGNQYYMWYVNTWGLGTPLDHFIWKDRPIDDDLMHTYYDEFVTEKEVFVACL